MPKKTGARNTGKGRRRFSARPLAPVGVSAEPEVETPVGEPAARQPIALRRTTAASTYAPRRERTQVAVAMPADYSYIGRELRRVGILLGTIVVVLAALTVVLR